MSSNISKPGFEEESRPLETERGLDTCLGCLVIGLLIALMNAFVLFAMRH